MGLSASQARLLLLTAKNDGLELEAQMISNERLLLSQEQETIADEYSDATSNMIYECTTQSVDVSKDNGKTGSAKKGMSFATFAQSQCGGETIKGTTKYMSYTLKEDITVDGKTYSKDDTVLTEDEYKAIIEKDSSLKDKFNDPTEQEKTVQSKSYGQKVAFSYGGKTYFAQATFDPTASKDSSAYTMQYWVLDEATGVMSEITDPDNDAMITALNDSSPYGIVQRSIRNGTGSLYVQDNTSTTGTDLETSSEFVVTDGSDPNTKYGFVRKSADSLADVSSRYYTEDDAAAQAKYNTAMNRVNAMDKKLENKLNQIETQKKAVETEMESAEQLIKTNVERTFKYFG